MIRSYNGRPLREIMIQGFDKLSLTDLQNIKSDLGLSMSLDILASMQNKKYTTDGKISADVLYMIDSYIDTSIAFSENVTFPELRTNSQPIEETIRDLMKKRHAIASQMPITFSSVADTYKSYLISAGYDSESVRPSQNYAIIEKIPSGFPSATDRPKRHIVGNCYGTDETNFAIAATDSPYRFNTQKERIPPHPKFPIPSLHLLMVKLDDTPFAFEELANIIHSNSHLAKDVIYCAPVGNAGLISTLRNTSNSYDINFDTVSALIGEEMNPFALNLKMNAAILIVDIDNSKNVAMSILDFGYSVRLIGENIYLDASYFVSHKDICHSLDTKKVDKLIKKDRQKVLTLCDTVDSSAFISTTRVKKNISLTAFSSASFSSLCDEITNAAEKLSADFENARPFAYLAMPVYDHEKCFTELLAVYRALAEHSIPLVSYSFIPAVKRENAALFLVCDDKVTT